MLCEVIRVCFNLKGRHAVLFDKYLLGNGSKQGVTDYVLAIDGNLILIRRRIERGDER